MTVCWGHDTADGVRDMARLKHRLRARLNSTGGSVRATGGGSPGTRAPNERGEPRTRRREEKTREKKTRGWGAGGTATKADVRVVTVPPPPHPAGVALAAAIAGEPMARQPPDAVEALAQASVTRRCSSSPSSARHHRPGPSRAPAASARHPPPRGASRR